MKQVSSSTTDMVYLFIHNSKPMFLYFQQFINDKNRLAEEIKYCLEELRDNTEGVISDWMKVAIQEVDFQEVAKRLINW